MSRPMLLEGEGRPPEGGEGPPPTGSRRERASLGLWREEKEERERGRDAQSRGREAALG